MLEHNILRVMLKHNPLLLFGDGRFGCNGNQDAVVRPALDLVDGERRAPDMHFGGGILHAADEQPAATGLLAAQI